MDICEEIDSFLVDETDDYSWPMSIKDLCKNFDLNRGTVHRHKSKYLTKEEDYFIQDSGRPDRAICFYKVGALKIFKHSRSEKAVRYFNKHGSSLSPKEEHLYINTIIYAIRGFETTKKGFKVETSHKDYNIDLYLENAKLAIECDEHDHYGQEYSDEKREDHIIKELGCKFLRFNPHEPNFNIGEVINAVFNYLLNKLINGKDPIDYYMEKRQRTTRKRRFIKINEEELV